MDTKRLRQKILDLAIRGKLVPQDPNDEPASVLLERISAEKERLIKEGKIKRSKKSTSDTPHYENMPFEIPKSWEWVSIADIAIDMADGPFGSNLKASHYTKDREVRIIQLSNIGDEGWREENTKYTTFEHLKEISRSEVLPNDIIIAKMMPAGRAIICPNHEPAFVLSSDAVKLRPSKFIDVRYILHAINSPIFQEQVQDNVQGVTRLRTSIEKLKKYFIPLPPYSEQKRIVKSIDQHLVLVDNIDFETNILRIYINKCKAKILELAIHGKLVPQNSNDEPALDLLKRINPSFVPCDNAHYENVPSNWTVCMVKEVFRINPKTKASDNIDAGFVPMSNIQDSFKNSISFEPRTWGSIKKGYTHFEDGDIVVAKISPCLENRKSAVIDGLPNGIGAGTTELNVFRSEYVHPLYGLFFFKSDFFISQCVGSFNGVVGQQRVSTRIIEDMVFPVPPRQEQERIINKVNELFQILDDISTNL